MHRLVILGDPHIRESEYALWKREIIPDINTLDADFVLVLGDLTGGSTTGTAQGTDEAVKILSGLERPWLSIIGNHDLQAPEFETDEAAVGMMLRALGREEPGFVMEEELFAVIGLSNTYWRRNSVNKNEIVMDDAQIAWWKIQLERLGDKPVIILGHAPPIGSGLMVLPELHARVGNAYMNQNATPGQIQQVIWEHPNVVFWFSGHTHLGQHYRDAVSRRLGVVYAHTGTAGRILGRDGCRHSRVLEIGREKWRLRTFDHGLRAMDSELDREESGGLAALVAARKHILGKRFVPADPATMAQGPGLPPPDAQRFVFLSDAHSTAPLTPIAGRIAAWCSRQIRALAPDRVILGGDITHRAIPAQAEAFLEALAMRGTPLDYLPGNNEGPEFAFPPETCAVRGCVDAEGSENVFLLATSTIEEAATSVDALLARLPTEGACLVFAHFPPFLAGEERLARLEKAPVRIRWICGHRHEALESAKGNLAVTVCAGLDPIKARRSVPELLVVDWDGREAAIQRIRVPDKFLHPAAQTPLHCAGVAFRGDAETLLRVGLERRLPAIQFHYLHSRDAATEREKALAQEYRDAVPGAFLSLHLPNFPHPAEGVDLADQEPWLQWAEDMDVDNLTIHLPAVSANFLFDENGAFRTSPWTDGCLDVYERLSRRALRMGAQISFENVYNKKVNPPGEERLGSQPWHLLRFVEAIRERAKVSDEQRQKIGIIFDAGHAFADVQIAKFHGLADWLSQVAPYLQLAHIHQVTPRPEGGGTQNHQVIADRFGPLINYTGLLSAFRDASENPIPLLIEVRGEEDALKSWETVCR